MLHPSYTDLMKVVNKDVEEGETKVVNSRYSIVMATAKRAREIIDGSMPLVDAKVGEKPLSIAIDELNSHIGLVKCMLKWEETVKMLSSIQDNLDLIAAGVEDPYSIHFTSPI